MHLKVPQRCVNNLGLGRTNEEFDMESVALTPKQLARFEAKIAKDAESGCHLWTAYKNESGYGRLTIDKRLRYAHRVSYAHHVGPIPDGMMIDHMCFTPACVNPEHMRLVTNKQNSENHSGTRAASGYRGVHRNGKGWRAVVRHNYVWHTGPTVYSPEEANEMAIAMRRKFFTHNLRDRQAA